MTNYQYILTTLAGSRWARLLRIVFAVYQLADFCIEPCDIPVAVGKGIRVQVEALLPGH